MVVTPDGILATSIVQTASAICCVADCTSARPRGLAAAVAQRVPYANPYATRSMTPCGLATPQCWETPGTIHASNGIMPRDENSDPTEPMHSPTVFSLFAQWRSGAPSVAVTETSTGRPDSRETRIEWFAKCLQDLLPHVRGLPIVAFPWRVGCSPDSSKKVWKPYKELLDAFASKCAGTRVLVVRDSRSFVAALHPERQLIHASNKAYKKLSGCKDALTRTVGKALLSGIEDHIRAHVIDGSPAPTAEDESVGSSSKALPPGIHATSFAAQVHKMEEHHQVQCAEARTALRLELEREAELYRDYLRTQLREGLLTPAAVRASMQPEALARHGVDDQSVNAADSGYTAVFDSPTASVVGVEQIPVALCNLRSQSHMNGATGVISGVLEDGRYSVTLDEQQSRTTNTAPVLSSVNCKGQNLVRRDLSPDSVTSPFVGDVNICSAIPQPDLTVSSADGSNTPARILGLKLCAASGARVDIESNILDTGSATMLGFKTQIERLERENPGSIQQVKPKSTSISRIRGIGALNSVLYWVALTIDIGGAIVRFTDIPVLPGDQGLLLGNDFLGKGRVQWSYGAGEIDGVQCDGHVVVRDGKGLALSRNVPFVHRAGGVGATVAVAVESSTEPQQKMLQHYARLLLETTKDGHVKTDIIVRRALTEQEIEDTVAGATPLAYAPQTIIVPARSERFIRLRAPSAIAAGHDVAILPLEDERREDLGVLVAPTLQTVDKHGFVTCRVINMMNVDSRLPLLAPMARFVIDPKEYVEPLEFTVEKILASCRVDPCHGEAARKLIAQMLSSRRRLFRSELGRAYAHGYQMRISMPRVENGEVDPPNDNVRPLPAKELAALEEAVKKQLRMGLIEPSSSPFNARPMCIPKATGGFRVVLDYRRCNELVTKDTYPLKAVDQQLSTLGKANWFTSIDLLMGFHQIELAEGFSKDATAFGTHMGQFRYVRAPMGLTTSPATFIRLVDAVLRGLPPGIAHAYVDDIIIPTSGSLEDHLKDVGTVMDRLIEGGFTVRADKISLAMRETPFLGFIVGQEGTRPDPSKLAPLLDMAFEQFERDPSAIARFAGMINVYYQFLPDLHIILGPFRSLRSKLDPKAVREHVRSLTFRAAFEAAKYALANVAARARPDNSKTFYVDVDTASSSGIGAVLTQRAREDDPESHYPLGFYSRRFADAERRYGVRDQECLGVLEALKQWRPILLGYRVVVRTDHRSLAWLLRTAHPNGSRIAGYALEIQEYDPSMEWVPGAKHTVPDCLSRHIPTGPSPPLRTPIGDRLEAASSPLVAAATPSFQPMAAPSQVPAMSPNEPLSVLVPPVSPGVAASYLAEPLESSRKQRVERAALLMVRRNDSGRFELLIEQIGGELSLPEALLDPLAGVTTPYRTLLHRRLQEPLAGSSPSFFAALDNARSCRKDKHVGAGGYKPRDTRYVLGCADSACTVSSVQQRHGFVNLDIEAVLSLSRRDDREFVRAFLEVLDDARYESVGHHAEDSGRRRGHKHFGNLVKQLLPVPATTVATAAVEGIDVDISIPVPSFAETQGRHPSLCTSKDHRAASLALCTRVRDLQASGSPDEACVSIDLEGHLRGKAHISLLQAAADPVSKDDRCLALVYDTHRFGKSIFSTREDPHQSSTLAALLADPLVPKVFHCCYGDLYALWDQYRIRVSNVFDTGVADCLIRGRSLAANRGLGEVLRAYLGEESTPLEYKGKLTFTYGLFDERPLPYHLFVYSYQDVIYCCRLYVAMHRILKQRCLDLLCRGISDLRAPLELRTPVDNVAVALHDHTHVLVLRHRGTGLFRLPAARATEDLVNVSLTMRKSRVLAGVKTVPEAALPSRQHAVRAWTDLLGPLVSGAHAAFNRLRKPQVLGSYILYHSYVSDVETLATEVSAMSSMYGASSEWDIVARPLYLRDMIGVDTEHAPLFQFLHYDKVYVKLQNRPQADDSTPFVSAYCISTTPTGSVHEPTLRVAASLHVSAESTVRIGLCNIVLGKTKEPGKSAALVLHDETHVYVLENAKGALCFPEWPLEFGIEPLECAYKGFDLFAGGLRNGGFNGRTSSMWPLLSQKINGGYEASARIGVKESCDNTQYFNCYVKGGQLADNAASFFAARLPQFGHELNSSVSKRFPSWHLVTFAAAQSDLSKLCDRDALGGALQIMNASTPLGAAADPPQSLNTATTSLAAPSLSPSTLPQPPQSLNTATTPLAAPSPSPSTRPQSPPTFNTATHSLTDLPVGADPAADLLFEAAVCVAFSRLVGTPSDASSPPAFVATSETAALPELSGLPPQATVSLAELCGVCMNESTECRVASAVQKSSHTAVASTLAGLSAAPTPVIKREEVLAEQWKHPGLRNIASFLKLGTMSEAWLRADALARGSLVSAAKSCSLHPEDGLLLHGSRIFLPPACQKTVFLIFHDCMAHLGLGKCFPLINDRFYWNDWRSMRKDVARHINLCVVCQRTKLLRHKPGAYQTDDVGDHPWDIIAVDEYFVGKALEIDGYHATLDFGDLFGRAISTNSLTEHADSEIVAQVFVDVILRHHGRPREVRADAANVLISKAIAGLYKRFGVTLKSGAGYQHKLVAFIERWHQTLRQLLDSFILSTGDRQWYKYLSLLELSFNTTVNATTGYSPFFLDHMRHAVLPYDTLTSSPANNSEPLAEWAEQHLKRRGVAFDAVSQTLRVNMLARKKIYDLRHDVALKFRLGDLVLRMAGTKSDPHAVHPKGTDFWLGPCEVLEVKAFDDYLVKDQLTKRRYVVHISRLKPAPPRRTTVPQALLDRAAVHSIVGRRVQQNADGPVVWYRIRWGGLTSLADEWRERALLQDIAGMVAAYDAVHPLPEGLVSDIAPEPPLQSFETPAADAEALERRRFRALPEVRSTAPPSEPAPSAPSAPPPASEPPALSPHSVPSQQQLEELRNGWLSDGSRVQVYFPHESEWWAGTVIPLGSRLVIPRKIGNSPQLHITVRWDQPSVEGDESWTLKYGGAHEIRPMRTRQPPVVKDPRVALV